MTTWHEVKAFASNNWSVTHHSDDMMSIDFAFDDERSQTIYIVRSEAYDEEWIEYSSRVCSEDELAPKAALRRNATLSVGRLGIEDGEYWLYYSILLRSADTDEFVIPMKIIASAADDLEEEFVGEDSA